MFDYVPLFQRKCRSSTANLTLIIRFLRFRTTGPSDRDWVFQRPVPAWYLPTTFTGLRGSRVLGPSSTHWRLWSSICRCTGWIEPLLSAHILKCFFAMAQNCFHSCNATWAQFLLFVFFRHINLLWASFVKFIYFLNVVIWNRNLCSWGNKIYTIPYIS